MGRLAFLLIAGILVTLGLWFTAEGRSESRSPSYSAILQRSTWAMSAINAVHGSGRVYEGEVGSDDPRFVGSWRVQGDCVTRGATTTSRFAVRGKRSGRHARAVDEQYMVRLTQQEAPSIWQWPSIVWMRSVHPATSWHRTEVTHGARLVNSMCPSLIIPQPLPGPVQDMGRTHISGRSVEHLHSEIDGVAEMEAVDLYVDSTSFRWVRVLLRGWGLGCCSSYSSQFDYSRYNAPVRVRLPASAVSR